MRSSLKDLELIEGLFLSFEIHEIEVTACNTWHRRTGRLTKTLLKIYFHGAFNQYLYSLRGVVPYFLC